MVSLASAEESGDLDFILELAKESIYVDLRYKILCAAKNMVMKKLWTAF